MSWLQVSSNLSLFVFTTSLPLHGYIPSLVWFFFSVLLSLFQTDSHSVSCKNIPKTIVSISTRSNNSLIVSIMHFFVLIITCAVVVAALSVPALPEKGFVLPDKVVDGVYQAYFNASGHEVCLTNPSIWRETNTYIGSRKTVKWFDARGASCLLRPR